MVITERHGYVLTWFFAAPHDAELQSLTNERVLFDTAPPAQVVSASKSGGEMVGNGSAEAIPGPNTASPPAATPSNSAPASASPASAASTQSASSSGDPGQGATTSTAPPSLLRPGETMQSQQGKGEVIPRKNQ